MDYASLGWVVDRGPDLSANSATPRHTHAVLDQDGGHAELHSRGPGTGAAEPTLCIGTRGILHSELLALLSAKSAQLATTAFAMHTAPERTTLTVIVVGCQGGYVRPDR